MDNQISLPSGNRKQQTNSAPSTAAIFSKSSRVRVFRFTFWFRFEGVVSSFRASSAWESPLYVKAIFNICSVVILPPPFNREYTVNAVCCQAHAKNNSGNNK
nr:MAG TPA: hypothetical protein [Caudoviricetes sp.]